MRKSGKKQSEKPQLPITVKMMKKLAFIFIMFAAMFAGLVIRLIYIDYVDGDRYTKNALKQQYYNSRSVPFKRGSILDRNGTVLAQSVRYYNLVLEPGIINTDEKRYRSATVKAIADKFGFSESELNSIIDEKPDSNYVVLKKDVPYDDMKAFSNYASNYNNRDTSEESDLTKIWQIAGYNFEEYYKREYPLKRVASHVLGYTNAGNVGTWGIEQYYNDRLNGSDGRSYGHFNADRELQETTIDPKNGLNVVLTIMSNVQSVVQKIIDNYMKDEGAENVGIVVMNPNNGEIYAMASNKEFDLNNPRDLSLYYSASDIKAIKQDDKAYNDALNDMWRNFCISDMYEPGSTFKPFTVSACLEEKTTKKNQSYVCDGGEEMPDGTVIHCVKREGHGTLTLTQALTLSCNDVMMQISKNLGRHEFARYESLFGIGSLTGIDLPGEAAGSAYDEKGLNTVELATSSFGQGVSVTMIQMAAGFSSIVNGGTYFRPHIVKELTNDAGLAVETVDPVILRKTVSSDTADFIRKAALETVESGTAKRAQVKGYKVGGKTGTAQKIDRIDGHNVRSDTNYVVSFIGCVPADDPQAVVYVVIDEPHVANQENDTSASALAGKVIKQTFPMLGIYPDKNYQETGDDKIVNPPTQTKLTGEDEEGYIFGDETVSPSAVSGGAVSGPALSGESAEENEEQEEQ